MSIVCKQTKYLVLRTRYVYNFFVAAVLLHLAPLSCIYGISSFVGSKAEGSCTDVEAITGAIESRREGNGHY